MSQENVINLADRQDADASECERLSAQLYARMYEWEAISARQQELERQFVHNDLLVRSGPRKGHALSARRRRDRLAELLELHLRGQYLQRALAWTEQRRNHLLRKQTDFVRGAS